MDPEQLSEVSGLSLEEARALLAAHGEEQGQELLSRASDSEDLAAYLRAYLPAHLSPIPSPAPSPPPHHNPFDAIRAGLAQARVRGYQPEPAPAPAHEDSATAMFDPFPPHAHHYQQQQEQQDEAQREEPSQHAHVFSPWMQQQQQQPPPYVQGSPVYAWGEKKEKEEGLFGATLPPPPPPPFASHPPNPFTHPTHNVFPPPARASLDDEYAIGQLLDMFPDHDVQQLHAMLVQCGGDLDRASEELLANPPSSAPPFSAPPSSSPSSLFSPPPSLSASHKLSLPSLHPCLSLPSPSLPPPSHLSPSPPLPSSSPSSSPRSIRPPPPVRPRSSSSSHTQAQLASPAAPSGSFADPLGAQLGLRQAPLGVHQAAQLGREAALLGKARLEKGSTEQLSIRPPSSSSSSPSLSSPSLPPSSSSSSPLASARASSRLSLSSSLPPPPLSSSYPASLSRSLGPGSNPPEEHEDFVMVSPPLPSLNSKNTSSPSRVTPSVTSPSLSSSPSHMHGSGSSRGSVCAVGSGNGGGVSGSGSVGVYGVGGSRSTGGGGAAAAHSLVLEEMHANDVDTDADLVTCDTCCCEYEPRDMAVLACNHTGLTCWGCVGHWIKEKANQGCLPCCPTCPSRTLEEREALKVVDVCRHSRPLPVELYPLLCTLYLASGLASIGIIYCPAPGCGNGMVPYYPGQMEKCTCELSLGGCGFEFCSLCRERYHYGLKCVEVPAIANAWDAWIQTGRMGFMRQRAAQDAEWQRRLDEYTTRKDKHSKEVQAAMARRAELMRDEKWKQENCKICPHCRRVVEKIDGCNLMRCGYDTDTKLNQQNGCGNKFQWDTAEPYKAADKGGPNAPVAFVEAPPVAHAQPAPLTLAPGIALQCDECHRDVSLPAFRCIHCKGEVTVCVRCEDKITQKGGHDPAHIFRIIKQ